MPNKIINVLIVIDAETIIQQLPSSLDPEYPTNVCSGMVYIIIRSDDRLIGDPSLTLSVRVGDVIRWRATTPSYNMLHSALFCDFKANPNELISPVQSRVTKVNSPYPDENDPDSPKRQIIIGNYWGCDVLKRGKVTYRFDFMILDRDNEVLGYYYSEASLEIKF